MTDRNAKKGNTKKRKTKKKDNTGFLTRIASFFDNNRAVLIAAVVIIGGFTVLSGIKKNNEAEKLNYSGLSEETEESHYPVSDINHEYFFQDEYNFRSYDDGKITSRRGIDVSEHQGDIDWEKVKESGVEFAFIRVGYRTYDGGNIKEDNKFRYNIEGALENGIEVGVYFFSQAISVDESIEEAKFTVDQIRDYNVTLPIAHDMEEVTEEDRIMHLTSDDRTAIADAFCEIVENYGYDSLIYANPSWLLTKLNIFKIRDRNVWLAHYTDKTPYIFRYEIWQYSDSGIIDGIDEPVDLNVMFIRNE